MSLAPHRPAFRSLVVLFLLLLAAYGSIHAQTIDFADWSLEPESVWVGPVPEDEGTERPGPFGGTDRVGMIESGGVQLVNRYNLLFGNWSGFAVSNQTDNVTPGVDNQAGSFAGGGAGGGDDPFAVGFGYVDDLDPTQPEQLMELPFLELPAGVSASSMLVTNTTYTALSMLHGDQFAKKFGGEDGRDADFFRLSVYGVTAGGLLIDDIVELFLADYRFEDSSEDMIVNQWSKLDLAPLSAANRLYFNLDSTDSSAVGMGTPAYFAIDNIVLQSPRVGDFDGDGVIDTSDVNLLCSAIAADEQAPELDLDNDQLISASDLAIFLDTNKFLTGDTNLDGQVVFDDFLRLSGNFGGQGTWSDGDSNCDGRIEFPDFLQLSGNFGVTSSAMLSVPEPGNPVIHLMAMGLCFFAGRFLRRDGYWGQIEQNHLCDVRTGSTSAADE